MHVLMKNDKQFLASDTSSDLPPIVGTCNAPANSVSVSVIMLRMLRGVLGYVSCAATDAQAAPFRVLGASYAGFWDGIVLHQLLQWHHMICLNEPCLPHDLDQMDTMMRPDGVFHLGMYVLNLIGVGLLLLSAQQGRAKHWTFVRALCWMVQGGGIFQVVEGTLDHLILKIHRVRPRSPAPLAWDLAFLAMGAGLIAIATFVLSKQPSNDSEPVSSSSTVPPMPIDDECDVLLSVPAQAATGTRTQPTRRLSVTQTSSGSR